MRTLLFLALFALSGFAQATNNEGCRGNCQQPDKTYVDQDQLQKQSQGQSQGQTQGQAQSADATAVAGAIAGASANNHNSVGVGVSVSSRNDVDVNTSDYNANLNANENTNVANGGRGGDAEQSQDQTSINLNDNSNSSNNSSSQSTSLTFESTGEAEHYNKYGNNVAAYAPAIYSSSACTAGGASAGAAGMGFGISLGGAKQDKQCQIRENARILSGLDPALAIAYLCKNPGVDIGAVLGEACHYTPPPLPPVVVPEPKQPETPVEVVDEKVKG